MKMVLQTDRTDIRTVPTYGRTDRPAEYQVKKGRNLVAP